MDINNVSNGNSSIWKGLQDAIESLESLKGTDVGTVLGPDGKNLTVTFTGTDGVARTIQLDLPEIEDGTVEVDPEVVNALLEEVEAALGELEDSASTKLEDLEDMVEAFGANAQSTGFRKALFDVYALMCLMVDLATQQREVARNLRQQELIGQVASIQAKAAAARTAALVGMLTTVGMAIAQLAITFGAAKIANRASKAAGQGETMGLGAAKADLKIVNGAAKDPKISAQNVVKYGEAAGAKLMSKVDKAVSNAVGKVSDVGKELQTKFETAKTKFEVAADKVTSCKGQVEKATVDLSGKKDQLQAVKNQIAELDQKQPPLSPEDQSMRANLQEQAGKLEVEVNSAQEKLDRCTNELQDAEGKLKIADTEFRGAEAEVAQASKEAYGKALDDFMTEKDAEYTDAVSSLRDLRKENPPNKAAIKEQEGKVAELRKERDYAKALVTDKKVRAGLPLTEDIQKASAKVEGLENTLKDDPEFKRLMAKSALYQQISMMASQMGSLVTAVSGFFSAWEQQSVAEKESEAARREAYRQESTELQESAQKLLDSVLQTLREFINMESSSLDSIINKI